MKLTFARLVLAIFVVFVNLISYLYIRSYFLLGGDNEKKDGAQKGDASPTQSHTDYVTVEARDGLRSTNLKGSKGNKSNHTDGYVKIFKEPLFSHKAHYAPVGGKLPEDGFDTYKDPKTWNKIDNGTCLYSDDEDEQAFEWQKNSPYAILLGTMKGGTHALSEYLWQHPSIAAPKNVRRNGHELHFFDSRSFERGELGIPRRTNQLSYAMKVHRMYPDFFYTKEKMYTIHDSPRYLVWSDRIPDAILCVTPWAKLIAVLRDPVERVLSHYRFQDQARYRKGIPMVDWATWIQDDIELLRQAGVLQDWNQVNFEEFSGSEAELLAWKKYLRSRTSQMIVGRGLYSLQIEHYFAAMEKAGKPRSDLLVLRSEELRKETQSVYDRVIKFLDLPRHVLNDTTAKHETQKTSTPIPADLRRQLEKIYEPYNRRLDKLMGWNSIWNYNN